MFESLGMVEDIEVGETGRALALWHSFDVAVVLPGIVVGPVSRKPMAVRSVEVTTCLVLNVV